MTSTALASSSPRAVAPSDPAIRRTVLFVAGLGAVTLYLLFSPTRNVPGGALEDTCALLVMWVAAVPAWRFVVSGRHTMPFLAAVCALYMVYLVLPHFQDRHFTVEPWEPPPEAFAPTLAIALLGVSTLVTGFYGSGPLLRRLPAVRRPLDLTRSRPVFIIIAFVSLIVRVIMAKIDIPPILGQPLYLFLLVGEVCLGGLLLASLRGQLPPVQRVLLVALISGPVLSGILTGSLANGIWPLLTLLFVYCWERRRLPLGLLLAGIIIFVPLNAAKREFRIRYGMRAADAASQTSSVRAEGFVTSVKNVVTEMSVADMLSASTGRFDMLGTFAAVVQQTPERVPYWEGESYGTLFWHMIPRALVPEKPDEDLGSRFPVRYGFLGYQNNVTSFNFPQLVEWYANFGIIGVALGMMLTGAIYRILDHSLPSSTGGALIASAIYSRGLNVETNFTATLGGIPLILLMLYFFIRLLPRETAPA